MKLHSKNFRLILNILIGLTVVFIFRNSLMSRADSAEESLKFYYLLKPLISMILPVKLQTHEFVRKVAHFSEFGILSFEMCLLFCEGKPKDKVYKIFFVGLFVAVIDETIQYFVGRGSMVLDCLIDFSGVVTAFIIFEFIIKKIIIEKRNKGTI